MWATPTTKQLAKIPAMGSTDGSPLADRLIYMHFFVGSCDWYICEYDPETDEGFGFANLGDPQCAEWGYISIAELREIKIQGMFEVDCERGWKVKKASEIPNIVNCGGV